MKLVVIIKRSIIVSIMLLFIFCLFNNNSNEFIYKGTLESEYLGFLVIPKIDMNLGFYDISDKRNNVDKNIELLKMEEGSTFIAAHSGVGKIAYFNDLRLLEISDEVILRFNDKEEKYIIIDIYKEEKNGKIHVSKKDDEKILVLTTCDQIIKGYQLIIKAVLK